MFELNPAKDGKSTVKTVILPNGEKYKIIFDRFQEIRGAPKIFDLFCSNCGEMVLIYQKDGPGPLLRCYLDRMAWPEIFSEAVGSLTKDDMPEFSCKSCNTKIGIPMIYQKEYRFAYLLIDGSIRKKARSRSKLISVD